MGERVDEKRGRLSKRWRERERERDREKDEESMRLGREGKVSEKQMCRNCMPTMNVNTPSVGINCLFSILDSLKSFKYFIKNISIQILYLNYHQFDHCQGVTS